MVLLLLLLAAPASAVAQEDTYNGSQLWLRYTPVPDAERYRATVSNIVVENASANPVYRHTANLSTEAGGSEKLVRSSLEAAREELTRGLSGLLGTSIPAVETASEGSVVVGTRESSPLVAAAIPASDLLASEGYVIRSVGSRTIIAGRTELGALYGTFAFLRLIQTAQPIATLNVTSAPKIKHRHLNYWDTERLYAGNNANGTGGLNGENGALFNFAATGASAARNLPVILDRYLVFARAVASLGINGITINNVNANNAYLTNAYIAQEAALADALRPYGVRLALSVRYDAPTDNRFAPDTLTNAQLEPEGAAFRSWWTRKATQLKASIPDFLGFTVKANSEGQPGPQDFGDDHGDGANGIGAAVADLGMKVFWRTFVYNADVDNDRLKRPLLEFGPIDDERRFASNVFLQTKNGPLDFQAREPVHPMFGRMENTNQAMELQITQEYTGQNRMLTYLGPMWEEVLKTDTGGAGLVGAVVDGTSQGHADSALVGVANVGNHENMTGHHFGQANLYAFGRLAWDWTTDSETMAREWVRMTWSQDPAVVDTIVAMMMGSWEAHVSHHTPLGVAHQFTNDVHYGPNPGQWFQRDDWSPVYYNKADSAGLGFDRSPTGSNFVAQYLPGLREKYSSIETTPENLLMWFHHVPWDRRMASGRIFWDELVYRYQMGVQYVTWMRETWETLQPVIGARRWAEVRAKLAQHEADAITWRDANVNYFREHSGRPMPVDGAPLSLAVTVGGVERRGFDLSASSYTVPGPITAVRPLDSGARAELVSQSATQAVVKVTKTDFFGPLVKNYVFDIVPDTSLRSLRVNRRALTLKPGVLSYNALIEPGAWPAPVIDAVATDPAATVSVDGTRVTVTNGGASSVYVVNVNRAIRGGAWSVVRPDDARRRVRDDGAVVITSQAGDLQGATNTARNLVLQDVNGDWVMQSKVVFSRALAANNEQGGIVAYADDQNYVKLAWEMSSVTQPINKLRVVFLREQNGTAQTFQVTGADAQRIVGAGGAIWLRVAKSGSTYKAYYSSDGAIWKYFATTSLNVEPARAGLLAFNRAGTSTDLDVAFEGFQVESVGEVVPTLIAEAPATVGGTVPATLALTVGSASFPAFVPGVAGEYTATTTATVTSSAGDAALSVSGGHLVNGAFSLAQPLGVSLSRAAWSAPTSREEVGVTFTQAIGASEPLRTGTYSRAVTFTLSTTAP
ncbi:DUF1349 domain-containing protein [Solirubrobacter sp. CPCC 204708]|nr:DUF1349 domain-containing protein [Solirubrobacter deserti]